MSFVFDLCSYCNLAIFAPRSSAKKFNLSTGKDKGNEATPSDKIVVCSFLTLQGCLQEIILHNDDKNYEIPQIGKATLEWAGILPDRLAAR